MPMQFAPVYPLLHRVLSPLFPDCLWAGNPGERSVALTFDDGPHPQHTPPLLEVLDRYGVVASFFWLGGWVQRSPVLAQSIDQRGHWIGLHSYDHRSFPLLSATDLRRTLEQTQAAITQACGHLPHQLIRDVRPPNGLFTPKTLALLHEWGYRPVMWSVVPEDWVRPGIATVVQRVLQQVRNGSIIVLHDGPCGGEDVAETVAQLIPALQQQGYRFVTIDHFWQTALADR
jgi:peptidoglycan/xylan/chitin deacetylase (PgdA/CDA1 family)